MSEARLGIGFALVGLSLLSCAPPVAPAPRTPKPPLAAAPQALAHAVPTAYPLTSAETHFASLQQLTTQGENAEAYWSFDGRELVLQSKHGAAACDRIYRFPADGSTDAWIPVSSGLGATTCSYFTPDNQHVLFASTHLGGDACPPPPDRTHGYVWALYDTYDIWKTSRDGGALTRLTASPGYDAEATVCAKDGSILFTSVRDGDLELYRMDANGDQVQRLTHSPGYDGGAFFSPDCKRIVWRASRPKPGQELADYKQLLAQNLVRPSRLELYVANADGSDPVQVTYLDAASFAPYWHPAGDRLLFSSNYGDPKGREFDLFAINVNGTQLERITHTPGFDGFPMFSPDGKRLAFSSNRATAPGAHDTQLFIADWQEGARTIIPSPADRVFEDVAFLADPAREGRGIGTAGLESAGAYIEQRLQALGFAGAGDAGSFRQSLTVPTALQLGHNSQLKLGGEPLAATEYVALGFSPASSHVTADVVAAGYGVTDAALGVDDYKGVQAQGKIVVVRRFVAEDARFSDTQAKRRFGDLRYKAWIAKQHGARALLVVDAPTRPANAPADWTAPTEAPLPKLTPEGYGDAGIPALVLRRAAGQPLLDSPVGKPLRAELTVNLERAEHSAFNVIGKLKAPNKGKLKGTLVIGAHYDHLGYGGRYSLAPESALPHLGADDNASGVAALLESARLLVAQRDALKRDVVIAAFTGEESGLLGSAHMVHMGEQKNSGALQPKEIQAMLNLDMVGRLRGNQLQVLGTGTATEWPELLPPLCEQAGIQCSLSGDGGYGPSDQTSFYAAGVPVLFFFTGSHSDYHKPTDSADRINAAGIAHIAQLVSKLGAKLSAQPGALHVRKDVLPAQSRGDLRSFNASLGTIPDYGGAGPNQPGVLLSGVRPGGAAELAGMRRGDILVRLGKQEIRSVEDLMFVLNSSHPGESVTAGVQRDGKLLSIQVTFQEARAR